MRPNSEYGPRNKKSEEDKETVINDLYMRWSWLCDVNPNELLSVFEMDQLSRYRKQYNHPLSWHLVRTISHNNFPHF